MKKLVPICILVLFLCFSPLSSQVKPDGQKAWQHVNHLASDAFQGRKSGTPEYEKAAEYVASKMKEYGLKPGGDKGSYFQQVEFKNWQTFTPPTRLEVLSPRKLSLVPGSEWDFRPNLGTGSGIATRKTGLCRIRIGFARTYLGRLCGPGHQRQDRVDASGCARIQRKSWTQNSSLSTTRSKKRWPREPPGSYSSMQTIPCRAGGIQPAPNPAPARRTLWS